MLFLKNPESSTLQNSSCMATYLTSHKPSKWDKKDILGTTREARTNFYGLLPMDITVLADQLKLTFISSLSMLNTTKRTCQERYSIRIDGETESSKSIQFECNDAKGLWSPDYYYYYYYYYDPSMFFIPVLTGGFPLKFEWQQVSSGLWNCCILDDFESAVVFISLVISYSYSLFSRLFWTIQNVQSTIGITVIFIFPSFLAFSQKFFSSLFIFTVWAWTIHMLTSSFLLKEWSSDQDWVNCLYFKVPENSLHLLFLERFWFVHIQLVKWSNFHHLCNSQWIILPN